MRRIGLKVIPQPVQRGAGHMGQGLAGGHQTEITISLEAEQRHDLSDHLPVLSCQHDTGSQRLAT